MNSEPAGWLPLVFTTLGGGAVGSLIASYGTQARERRTARTDAMAVLQRFEIARGRKLATENNDFDDGDLAELETRCLLAGIPRYLVALYKLANESGRYLRYPKDGTAEQYSIYEMRDLVRQELVNRAAALLAGAAWHPWLMAPLNRWHARRLRRILFRTDPSTARYEHNRRRALREWETELHQLRRKRREHKAAVPPDVHPS